MTVGQDGLTGVPIAAWDRADIQIVTDEAYIAMNIDSDESLGTATVWITDKLRISSDARNDY